MNNTENATEKQDTIDGTDSTTSGNDNSKKPPNDTIEGVLDSSDAITGLTQSTITIVSDTVASLGSTIELPFTKFFPLIGDVASIFRELVDIYQTAEHNKRICGVLLDRVGAAEAAVRNLDIRRDDNRQFFTERNYIIFRKFIGVIKRIKNFANEISQITGLRKYLQAKSISQTFNELTTDFDGYMRSLSFSITIENQIQAEKDRQVLKEDTEALKQFLDKIDGGITDMDHKINIVIEEVYALKSTFERQQKAHHDQCPITEIVADELLKAEDYFPPETVRGKVVKRTRRADMVKLAFKEVSVQRLPHDMRDNIHAQVTILKRIRDSQEITRFFGLAKENDLLYLVTEWAEFGNLKEYYTKYQVDLDLKLNFALEVSRGLNFLASVQILHHDIRSDNVLITVDKHAKIANFGLSRGFTDATRNIKAGIQNVRYMAPEKFLDPNYKYDIKCEVYSFGMLLWEIAELRIPYKDETDILVIRDLVAKNHYRESFSHGGVPKEWKDLVKAAWNQDPKFRPAFTEMFLVLQKLREKNSPPRCSPSLSPDDSIDDEFNDQAIPINFAEFGDISVEEAIKEYRSKNGNKQNAWKCFEAHANAGDITAKYWKAYFLYYNILNWPESTRKERFEEAAKLFKEAADGDMEEAQLRYGNCLFKGEGTPKDMAKAAEYFKKAADNGNLTAMYNIGNIYYHGYGVKRDLVEGERFLKLAAYRQQALAVKMCKQKNIVL
ncbi:14004_t:CDS:2 [Cetraspora pellucida]|uniref:14004_t:CDS:1 n=1 Tax=Cetraspora pellucida TaxID=1433469 RepID=A0A9N9E641_9GLOM|nr:14004_t:CDS:2 [Cetraspora pellucida]